MTWTWISIWMGLKPCSRKIHTHALKTCLFTPADTHISGSGERVIRGQPFCRRQCPWHRSKLHLTHRAGLSLSPCPVDTATLAHFKCHQRVWESGSPGRGWLHGDRSGYWFLNLLCLITPGLLDKYTLTRAHKTGPPSDINSCNSRPAHLGDKPIGFFVKNPIDLQIWTEMPMEG